MKKLISGALCLMFAAGSLYAERITVTGSHTSPSGRYRELLSTDQTTLATNGASRVGIGTTTPDASAILEIASSNKGLLLPRFNSAPAGAQPQGLLIYNLANHRPEVFNGTAWVPLAGAGAGGPDPYWTLSGNDLFTTYPTAVNNWSSSDNVFSTLTVKDGAVLFQGSVGDVPPPLPTGYSMNLLMWIPAKAAFSAQVLDSGSRWDNSSFGQGSFSSGLRTRASGRNAIALGGYNAYADGDGSIAIGGGTRAGGANAVAMGGLLIQNGITSANGNFSYAFGCYVTAAANGSFVIGSGAGAANPLVNNIGDSLMVGINSSSPTLFVQGGTGNVGINTTNPAYALHVVGDISYPPGAVYECGLSDARLKTSLSAMQDCLRKIKNIHGISYEWNELAEKEGLDRGRRHIGLIAQEVEKEFPELVGGGEFKAVDYARFNVVLLEALKELKRKNETLMKKAEMLEGRP